eukprot:3302347-Pyramimonas_sp.AAC.1
MATPVDENSPASEHAKESATARPRECYGNADWPDHCCRTCRGSSERNEMMIVIFMLLIVSCMSSPRITRAG